MNGKKELTIITALTIGGVAVFEPAAAEPHSHQGENGPVEINVTSELSASGGGYSNTSAGLLSVNSTQWVLKSPPSCFVHDMLFANRLKALGITLLVELAPDQSAGSADSSEKT